MKLAEPPDATRALAAELRLPYVDLEDMLPEDNVLDMIPRRVIKRHSCLPLFEDRGRMLVACVDEPSHELEDEIRLRCGIPMRAVLAVPRAVNQAIAKYYAPGMREEAVEPDKPNTRADKKSKDKKSPKAEGTPDNEPKAAAKPARSKSAPLSAEEKSKRMQITLISTCWATIGTIGIMYLATGGQPSMTQIFAGPIAGAVTFGVMKLTYAKS
jgi:type II secretory ATPase GspE/PulE/Tfp pilus assembly ATPase PilB-like protein